MARRMFPWTGTGFVPNSHKVNGDNDTLIVRGSEGESTKPQQTVENSVPTSKESR